ncbi:MAG: hypothetical protein NVS9B7_20540 [Flavisolibacter sp.]
MMRRFIGFLLFILFSYDGQAQFTRYIIEFTDKGRAPFTLNQPSAYLSFKSINRRVNFGIKIDSSDLPVTPQYLDSLRSSGAVTILNISKWLNSVSIQTNDSAALKKILQFSFVKKSYPIAARLRAAPITKFREELNKLPENSLKIIGSMGDFYNYGLATPQIIIHHGNFLHNIGLRGQSMLIGMLDAGFRNYTSLHAFDSVNAHGQVLGVYDFVDHDGSVVEDDPHGMECFSTMAANLPGQFVGTAPLAQYYLFRTEDAFSEYPIEEHNWVCGAEKIDSAGGDIITSSLGYTIFDSARFNHIYADMNGKTTMAAKGAALGAKKGLIILNAVGNDGNSSWHFLSTPSDADSILAVGAVNNMGTVAPFSSYGPSSDGRIKPDVASVGEGTIIESPSNQVSSGSGTSFATPNLAGLTACLWQGFSELNNISILKAIKKSGSIASKPDSRIGYGIPDMKTAVMMLIKDFATVTTTLSGCAVTIKWKSKDVNSMKYEIERKMPGENIYFKIGDHPGTGAFFNNHTYQFIDSMINGGPDSISYRIREIIDTAKESFLADYIGESSLLLTTHCQFLPPTLNNTLTIFPDPSSSLINLRIVTAMDIPELHIVVINSLGQRVYAYQIEKIGGSLILPLNISHLSKGKYFVGLWNKNNLFLSGQFIKL